MTHRERLISNGLLVPLSDDAIYNRNGILLRVKAGEQIDYIPNWCVFRRDEQFRHIILEGKDECQSAELVADKLFSYEAHVLCDKLNFHDKEQPRAKNWLPPVGMYGICTMEEWEAWYQRYLAQVSLFEQEEQQ